MILPMASGELTDEEFTAWTRENTILPARPVTPSQ